MIHTALVIGLFTAMLLSPCVVATLSMPALLAEED